MKALWFMPFAFTAGAEGFALFVPYLLLMLTVLHLARTRRPLRLALPTGLRMAEAPVIDDVLSDAQPAL